MLSVPDRVSQLRINHVFNIYHGRAPEYLCENLNINQGITRGPSNLNFITPNANLCSTNSFSYNAMTNLTTLFCNILSFFFVNPEPKPLYHEEHE
jgi:hypothetical protein